MTDDGIDQVDDEQFDRDDELRALLRSADPARSLSSADPVGLTHLLEDIMSTDLDVRPVTSEEGDRATGTHGRNRLTWLVAAAAAVVIAGAGGFAISSLSGEGEAPPTASDSPKTDPAPDPAPGTELGTPVAGATTELTAPPSAKCAAPDPVNIGAAEQAFSGTVTAVEGDTVTIQTSDVFTGEVGETVVVTAPAAQLRAMISATKFEVGGSYLVSATGGMVAVCGFTGKETGALRSLYDQAFVR
jgi:hypothetical protein